MTTDYRTKSFQEKFASASAVLGVPPQEIMSVKLRDMVNSYNEYDQFFRELTHRNHMTIAPVTGEFQGKGFSLSDGQNTIILVEHESGLEILNVAGSVASLIGLVPLVVQGWRMFRRHRRVPDGREPIEIEVRRIDSDGKLTEEHAHDLDRVRLSTESPISFPFAALLENELRRINAQVASLTDRVSALESSKNAPVSAAPAKKLKRPKKKRSK